jgi:hypothetical protein
MKALILLACLFAEPQAVIAPVRPVPAGGVLLLDGSGSTSDVPLKWTIHGRTVSAVTFDKTPLRDAFLFIPAPEPGNYNITVQALGLVDGKPQGDVAFVTVTVGSTPGPVPPGPVPPGPTPPQVPTKVLIQYESEIPLDQARFNVLYSAKVRGHLNATLPKDSQGVAGWRIWDDDELPDRVAEDWHSVILTAATIKDPPVPRVLLFASDGSLIKAAPLPDNDDDLIKLIPRKQ